MGTGQVSGPSANPPAPGNSRASQAMWDELEKQKEKWKLSEVYRALLANRRARMLARIEQPVKAADEFKRALDTLGAADESVLRENLTDGLVGVAGILMFETRNYEQGVAVARLALSYDSGSRGAKHIVVLGKMGLKDYTGAHALLDELIEAYPDAIEFRSARYTAYLAQKKDDEARKELVEILKIKPDYSEAEPFLEASAGRRSCAIPAAGSAEDAGGPDLRAGLCPRCAGQSTGSALPPRGRHQRDPLSTGMGCV